ncbi:MAG: hypothetical protein WC246_00215 [Candidatus Paceibacterota bacterium]|jgi:hypothetical protein
MTDQHKNLFFGFFIVAVAFLLYWLFSSSLSQIITSPDKSGETASTTDAFPMGALDKGLNTESVGSLQSASPASSSSSTSSNLTDSITRALTSQFVSLPFSGQLTASSAQSLVEQINLQGAAGGLNSNSLNLNTAIDPAAFIITNDSSSAVILAYGNAYGKAVSGSHIITDLFDWSKVQNGINALVSDGSGTFINDFLKRDQALEATLKNMTVPRVYVSFHTKNLQFFSNVEKIFSAVATYQSDPVRAYMAFEALPDLITQWQSIQTYLVPIKN